MIQTTSLIAANEPLSERCWRMTFQWPETATEAKPGQFVNLRLSLQHDPLFRRPFSVLRHVPLPSGSKGLQIAYQVVGRGTEIMTGKRPGDVLDVIGPSGNGFRRNLSKRVHILLAGGIGAAGLFMLAEQFSRDRKDEAEEFHVLLGARAKDALILENDFRGLNGQVLTATEDGSYGFHGRVTDLLVDFLGRYARPSDCAVYACGPEPMYKELHPICREFEMPAQISVERRMMCGIGACLACVCRVSKKQILKRGDLSRTHIQFDPREDLGYALVCRDGPVFDLDEVALNE